MRNESLLHFVPGFMQQSRVKKGMIEYSWWNLILNFAESLQWFWTAITTRATRSTWKYPCNTTATKNTLCSMQPSKLFTPSRSSSLFPIWHYRVARMTTNSSSSSAKRQSISVCWVKESKPIWCIRNSSICSSLRQVMGC